MEITLVSELEPSHDPHLQVRWRLRKTVYGYTLALECLTIPMNQRVVQNMASADRELCEGPGAPVTLLWSSDTIQWIMVRLQHGFYLSNPPPPFFLHQPRGDLPITGLDFTPYLSLSPDGEESGAFQPQDAYIRR